MERISPRESKLGDTMTTIQARLVLGLPENFTLADLKTQYRKKVLLVHPDRNGGDNSQFIIVQRAFELLTVFKERGTIHPPNNPRQPTHTYPNPDDLYQQRRQAEQAYKQKVHYASRRRRAKAPAKDELFDDVKTNIKYFMITLLGFISFFILLLTSMAFGALGVLFFLIIFSTILSRVDFRKIKF